MNYTLNTEAAKGADTMNGRIDETGKYIGVFTRAESVESNKGTVGIDLSFRSNDGLTADYLSLWTRNVDGKEIYGFKVLMAVMTCMKTKGLTSTPGSVEKYDQGQQKRVTVAADIYPELMDKPIGLLLQKEEYIKKDNTIGTKMNIVGAFDPSTEMTASEILDRKTKPELLERMVAGLKDKILPASSRSRGNNEPPPHESAPHGGDYGDSDIPFAAVDWRF
ncbi:MAG: hypothetical protein PF483_03390 [Halothiobacillus sp.]|nr:hypothetical protein [Halothiobacillus sp.]